ncbi:EF-hand and coiled-coil domain-containing protein 1-like isoform X2, partial [Arapaima gigas]
TQRRAASPRQHGHMSIRAARRSEWLHGALAHHYEPDPGVDNEVVVLATGIDQYLQEVFHHLSFYNGGDLVSAGDFSLLCDVLGISERARDTDDDDEEARAVRAALPRELRFKEFHARLCGYFSARARGDATGARLPVTEETEHIEREIRLRWPRVRRRKCVSFDLSKDVQSRKRPKSGHLRHVLGKTHDDDTGKDSLAVALQRLEMENASLRELVEDLRSALQGSDARCLVLEVALRRERGPLPAKAAGERSAESGPTARPRARPHGPGTRYLLKELELIRASRDGQLEEAMRFSQRLEEELSAAHSRSHRLEETVAWLRRDNGQMKRMAEEARAALAAGLRRVKEIQGQARLVPSLQKRLQELQKELRVFRSSCVCRGENWSQRNLSATSFVPPLHAEREQSCMQEEEGLQRAVEGRAASDEEEEEKGAEVGQCCLVEVKRLIKRLHNCAKGCPSTAARHLLVTQVYLRDNPPKSFGTLPEVRGSSGRAHACAEQTEREVEKSLCSVLKDTKLRQEEVEALRPESRTVETERVRLSQLEEKLTEALSLLLQLRSQKVSQRLLGKILLDTLNISSKAGHAGASDALQVVDTLRRQLLSCELLMGERGTWVSSDAPQDAANPLLIPAEVPGR